MLVMQCCGSLDAEHIPEYGGMLSVELSIPRSPEYSLVSFRWRFGGVIASRLFGLGYTRKPLDERRVAARGVIVLGNSLKFQSHDGYVGIPG